MKNEVMERLETDQVLSDGYSQATIFTFPKNWTLEKCINYCKAKDFNPFVFRLTSDGRNELVCAFSWVLSYHRQFGEYPNGY